MMTPTALDYAIKALPIAYVENNRAPVTKLRMVPFEDIANAFARPEIGKKDGPGWLPADIDAGPRNNERVRSISFLVLDVEAKAEATKDDYGQPLLDAHGDIIKRVIGIDPPGVDDMMAELNRWGWRGLLHTTYSHSVEHPRYRLIFVLTRPLQPEELKRLGLHVAALLGLSACFDAGCLDAARLFYMPRVPSEDREQLYRCVVTEGAPLDVDALLDAAQKIEDAINEAKTRKPPSDGNSVIDAYNQAHDLGAILEAHDYVPKGSGRWVWPGSTTGMPGVRFLPDQGQGKLIYSSHGGDPLNDGKAHDAFDCYRILDCAGDMQAAVKKAAELMGMTVGVSIRTRPEPFSKEMPPTPWPSDCLARGMAMAAEAIAEHIQAPKALAGMAVLSAVSHLTMRLLNAYHPKNGAMPASLFLMTTMGSGERKTECYKPATKPIMELERRLREAYRANLSDGPDPRTIFTDTTIQKIASDFVNGSAPALSLSTDEGGILLGGHSLKSETRMASLGVLTRLFGGDGVERDRVGENQSGFRYGVRFGLFLSAQPIVVKDALNDPLLREQGFLPRFLYSAPESLTGTRFQDEQTLKQKVDTDPRITGYWNTLERLSKLMVKVDDHGGLVLPMVGMDADAIKVWLDFYNETERQQGPDGDFAHLKAFASRAGELAVRVAAVYAAWNCAENKLDMQDAHVTADDMRRAVALVGYSLAEWLRHSSGTALTAVEVDARDLLDWLHGKGWSRATRGQIGQYCSNALRKATNRRNAAIDELVRRGWLIESEGEFSVVEKQDAPPAVAVSAGFAVDPTTEAKQTAETAKTATATDGEPACDSYQGDLPNDFGKTFGG